MPARLIYGFICDDARSEEGTHKDLIVGIFDRFTISSLERPLPRFVIFGRVGMDDAEAHELRIDLRLPSGDVWQMVHGSSRASAEIHPAHGQRVFRCRVRVENLVLEEHGPHALVLHVDGEPIGEIPFMAARRDEPTTLPSEPPQPS